MIRRKASRGLVAVLALLLINAAPASAAREPLVTAGATERHCVAHVTDTSGTGLLETTSERCFSTVAEATAFATAGAVRLDAGATGVDAVNALESTGYSSYILGIHYDGYNGTGTSITVVGDSCSGGWWNTPTWFTNRISSSWAGCYRLTHYDYANMGGSAYHTYGGGVLFNLYYFNNRTGSVRYRSS